MKIHTVLPTKYLLIKAFFVFAILTTMLSCKKNEAFEKTADKDIFSKNNSEEIDAYFLVATANISKAIISKSQIAQQKCQDIRIKRLSSKIETNQNELLREITTMASKKLVIILNTDEKQSNDDLYTLIGTNKADFDKAYIDLIIESISDQIELLKSITRETNDTDIIKLSIKYLPTQYRFLDESKALKKE